jgi:LPXTG-site transpeptidase (sortase) family protein
MRKILIFFMVFFVLFQMPVSVHASPSKAIFSQYPTQIIIPSVGINLPVIPAQIKYDTWEVSLAGASFGEGSFLPGNKGNTVIFSHALPYLFANLVNLKKDQYIHVFTKNDWFVYKVTEVFVVDPQNTNIIFSKNNYELTLFTCTGDNYTKRFIVKAHLVSNPSAFLSKAN